jgi:hypothetical protein
VHAEGAGLLSAMAGVRHRAGRSKEGRDGTSCAAAAVGRPAPPACAHGKVCPPSALACAHPPCAQAVPEAERKVYTYKGVCIARANKGPRSWFKIYNVFPDVGGFVQHLPL